MKLLRTFGYVVLALLALWLFVFPSAWLHYKLSVDVDDNGVMRRGDGVIFVWFQSQGPLLIDNTPQWTIKPSGEAFAVDLGPRGAFFVLLSQDHDRPASCDAGRGALACYFKFYVNDLPNGLVSLLKVTAFAFSGAAQDLTPDQLPLLVRFRDINDPATVERVDPDRLELSFGPGVKIVRVRVELTSARMTTGIARRLPWLNKLDDRVLSGKRYGEVVSLSDKLNITDLERK